MQYYKEIKNKLIENENYARIKDYSKERYKIQTYYEVGKNTKWSRKALRRRYNKKVFGKTNEWYK